MSDLSLWDVCYGAVTSHMLTEGSAVVALVGIELFDSPLCANSQLVHGSFGTDNVVTVTFEGHTSEWQALFFGQERDVGTVAVVLAVVTDTGILRCLDKRTIKITEA